MKSLAVLLLALLPVASFAAGTSGIRTVRTFIVDPSYMVVTPQSNFDNPDSCTSSGSVMIQRSDPWFKEAIAAVMLAFAMEKAVSFWVSGCQNVPGGGTIPIVQSVSVNP